MLSRALFLVAAIGLALLGWSYATAVSDPKIRQARVALHGWPGGEAPVRAVLMSDLHVAGPDMPPERLRRIVGRVNALRPDFVFLTGDFISDRRIASRRYSLADAIAPLKALHPSVGTFAVLGNHDVWRDPRQARASLAAAGVKVLDNDAVSAGPLAIGGLSDAFTGHDDLPRTVARMRRLPGGRLILSHSPDPFPALPEDISLMLAGHTHCGQVRLPLVGAVSTMSRYGERYACGLVRERNRTLVVTAGLGTSIVPLRLGAAPDLWLLTLTPAEAR